MAALYRWLLGARFDALPARVRELHDVTGTAVWNGRADVERGSSLASQLAALLFSLPPDGNDQPLRVTFEPHDGREIWTRAFGARKFRSVQFEKHGMLRERVGPSCLVFALDASAEGLATAAARRACPRHPAAAYAAPMRAYVGKRAGRPLPLRGRPRTCRQAGCWCAMRVGWREPTRCPAHSPDATGRDRGG